MSRSSDNPIDPASLSPGDVLILPTPDGRWADALEYVGPDVQPDCVQVRRKADSELYSVSLSLLQRPRLIATPEAAAARQGDEVQPDAPRDGGLVTDDQRRLLFALARGRGMSTDDLRACTSAGSISKLTRVEASALIDRLRGQGRPGQPGRRSPRGTVTLKQLGMMEHLVELIGFTPDQLADWLAKRFGVRSLDDVDDKQQASRIIGGLLKMHQNKAACKGGRSRGEPPERSGAGAAG